MIEHFHYQIFWADVSVKFLDLH